MFDKIKSKSFFSLDSSSGVKSRLPSLRALEIYSTSSYNFSSKFSEIKLSKLLLIESSFLELETIFFLLYFKSLFSSKVIFKTQ